MLKEIAVKIKGMVLVYVLVLI
uniref:Uncharacterized protein n=1 Tax=Arundo donax TaxID=35708 RepID=A0A0A8YP43_ARUDO